MLDRPLVITGLMGVGKSSTGRELATRLGCGYADSDSEIEALTSNTGAEIAAAYGVEVLHRIEAAVLLAALVHPEPHVITAAASVVEDEVVRDALRQHAVVVRLTLPVEDVLERQKSGDHRRGMNLDELAAIAQRREPLFASVQDLEVDVSAPLDVVVATVLDHLES